ncbi:SOS response-associated peptidase [Maribellus luteus]|uniref:Abasic site processing protein n=2 Tax=Maribellus luteus TaxID=2305463 RepID=A0A399SQ76_9BACT|nr:SOS response-associated peptidase [Maribellus luteus]
MFDRFILASNIDRVKARFNMAHFADAVTYEPNYNIAAGDEVYVITDAVKKEIHKFRFGLNVQKRNNIQTLHFIRAEGNRNLQDDPHYSGSRAIFLQPEFKQLIRQQRCMILADAFIVGIESNPHLVYLRDKQRPFAFAGLYSMQNDDTAGESVYACAIITVPANSLLQKLGYKRMPVILPQQEEGRWLRSNSELSQTLNMLNSYPAAQMNAFPISDKIKDKTLNDISLVHPAGERVLYEPDYKLSRKRKREVRESLGITMAERAGIEVKYE